MRSNFSILGHPLHPMLVILPVGLFAWAFVSQLIFLTTTDHQWYTIAFWTSIAALSSGLIAAIPGAGDLLTIGARSRAFGMGIAHMFLNLTTIVLFFVAVLLMLNNNATGGASLIVASIVMGVGFIVLTMSGWLGGEMVYKHHLAVVPYSDEEERESEFEPEFERGDYGSGARRLGSSARRDERVYEQPERGYERGYEQFQGRGFGAAPRRGRGGYEPRTERGYQPFRPGPHRRG